MSDAAQTEKKRRIKVATGVAGGVVAAAIIVGVASCTAFSPTKSSGDNQAGGDKGNSFTVPEETSSSAASPSADGGTGSNDPSDTSAEDPYGSGSSDSGGTQADGSDPSERTSAEGSGGAAQGDPVAQPSAGTGDSKDSGKGGSGKDSGSSGEDSNSGSGSDSGSDSGSNGSGDDNGSGGSDSGSGGDDNGSGGDDGGGDDSGSGDDGGNDGSSGSDSGGDRTGDGDNPDPADHVDIDALIAYINKQRTLNDANHDGATSDKILAWKTTPDKSLYAKNGGEIVEFSDDTRTPAQLWKAMDQTKRDKLLKDLSHYDAARIYGQHLADSKAIVGFDQYKLKNVQAVDDSVDVNAGDTADISADTLLGNDTVLEDKKSGATNIVDVTSSSAAVSWDKDTGQIAVDTTKDPSAQTITFTYTAQHDQDPTRNKSGNTSQSTATVTVTVSGATAAPTPTESPTQSGAIPALEGE